MNHRDLREQPDVRRVSGSRCPICGTPSDGGAHPDCERGSLDKRAEDEREMESGWSW